ncbi:NAD(P)/FAD-dependent oxidoreductase [Ferrovum sp. PN-J185]|uniref:flavin-containing monooxygenase n=1 Tax=Ferrovum sp. PN-J185 TaxID=1356306 RepID=UPI001E60B348|nr:NAD(P)/FAD-dependent oxidoreductase [Ferrovum sp. PN-J185]MCC6067695.1 NAD(P)/FAD-dependent oxidoreductase [Ferrovum sp. PN-J185]
MNDHFNVIIVGAGISGISMALELNEKKVDKWIILEKESEMGGTWRDNIYPGSACDVPSILYQLKKAPSTTWSKKYANQNEILSYIKNTAKPIEHNIYFNEAVERLEFNENTNMWSVFTTTKKWSAKYVVVSMSPLSNPHIPNFKGADLFKGNQFHTAQWDKKINLSNQRVAVIGSGASAVQCIESIQPIVKELHLIQRNPSWVMSKNNKEYNKTHSLPNPIAFKYLYLLNYFLHELKVIFFINPILMKLLEFNLKRNIKKIIKNRSLFNKLIPNYPLGCKRIVLSDNYYQAVSQPNVNLYNTEIESISADSLTFSNGSCVEVDTIIYATGFNHSQFIPINIISSGKNNLKNEWEKQRSAYLGMFVNKFPNLFLLVGPNTGLGHQSLLFMIERQTRLLAKLIKMLLNQHVKTVEVKKDIQHNYQQQLNKRSNGTVWQRGCRSWYLDEHGRNVALWPFSSLYYWWITKKYNKNDFEIKY